jgi:hypothetical protein
MVEFVMIDVLCVWFSSELVIVRSGEVSVVCSGG